MIRFGVIGTGWITEEFIRCARLHPEVEVTAVYSRTVERGSDFATRLSIERVFTELDRMAQDRNIDAVYIASPNAFHAEQAVTMLRQGKHVMVEKPVAANSRQLQAMIDASRSSGAALMEAMKTVFSPGFKAVRENISRIGQIRRAIFSQCQYSSRYDAYKAGRQVNAFDPSLANGSLMDIGIYCVYPAIALFGRPEKVDATAIRLESGLDGMGSVYLQYGDKDAVVMHSKISNGVASSEIQGEEGTITIDKISMPGKVMLHFRDGRIETLAERPDKEMMSYEVDEFVRVILAGRRESALNPHAQSLAVMETMDEARRQCGIVFPADQSVKG